MPLLLPLLIAVHALAAAVWVGGLFFAYLALRPAVDRLEPPVKLPLLTQVFRLFFPWVWMAVVILLLSGYAMIFGYYGGMSGSGVHIHIMHAAGLLMMLLFAHLYFAPFRQLKNAVDGGDWPRAAGALGRIRTIIKINLVLGLAVIAVATSGRFW